MPDEGIYVTTAAQPEGRWSEPHLLQASRGLIEPCPLWDDDGRAYLVHAYAGSRAGIKHRLPVCPMAPDATRLLGEGQIVFHEPERHPTVEGPKFLKRDGWYYLFAPAGGVATGWQIALRSRHIFGPYEDRVVLAQGGTASTARIKARSWTPRTANGGSFTFRTRRLWPPRAVAARPLAGRPARHRPARGK